MFADRLKGMGETLGVLQRAFGWSFSSKWEGSNSEPPSCRRSLWGVCIAALQKAFRARESFFQELAPSEHSTLLVAWLVGRTLVLTQASNATRFPVPLLLSREVTWNRIYPDVFTG